MCLNPAEFVEKFFGKMDPEMLMQEIVSEKAAPAVVAQEEIVVDERRDQRDVVLNQREAESSQSSHIQDSHNL